MWFLVLGGPAPPTAAQLKRRLGRLLSPYWSTSRRTYAGFSDEEFYAPTEAEVIDACRQRPP